MRLIILILNSLMGYAAFSQSFIPNEHIYFDSLKLTKRQVSEIDTGTWYEFDLLNRVKTVGHFQGRIVDFTTYYFKRDSSVIAYDTDRYLRTDSGLIKDGLGYHLRFNNNDTISITFSEMGKLKWSLDKKKDGTSLYREYESLRILHGKEIFYYSNGIVGREGCYEKDIRVGKWVFYDENGVIDSVGRYSGRYRLDSTMTQYFPKEKWHTLPLPYIYLRKGSWKYYDDSGKIEMKKRYNRKGELIAVKEY